MMTKYYRVIIATALGDSEDYVVQINGWSEIEFQNNLDIFINACIFNTNEAHFDAEEIAARHMREEDYWEGAEVYVGEISRTEYEKQMNYD